jgi:hypothetical protein
MKNIAFRCSSWLCGHGFLPRRRVTRVKSRRSAGATPLLDPSLVHPALANFRLCFGPLRQEHSTVYTQGLSMLSDVQYCRH